MRLFLLLFAALSGCSTLQSRLAEAPNYSRMTAKTVSAFQACFVPTTANQNVNYLPRGNGGTFTATAGPQNYVMWAVTIDDLGTERRVSLHSVGPNRAMVTKIEGCL